MRCCSWSVYSWVLSRALGGRTGVHMRYTWISRSIMFVLFCNLRRVCLVEHCNIPSLQGRVHDNACTTMHALTTSICPKLSRKRPPCTYEIDHSPVRNKYIATGVPATNSGIPKTARIETSYTRVNMWGPHTRPRGLHTSVASSLAHRPHSAHLPSPKGSFNDIVEPPRLLCDLDGLSYAERPTGGIMALPCVLRGGGSRCSERMALAVMYKYQRRPVSFSTLKRIVVLFHCSCSLSVLLRAIRTTSVQLKTRPTITTSCPSTPKSS